MHHRTYARIGRELDTDLEALCRPCHDREHGTVTVLPPAGRPKPPKNKQHRPKKAKKKGPSKQAKKSTTKLALEQAKIDRRLNYDARREQKRAERLAREAAQR